MDFQTVLKALRRQKLAAVVIGFEIALACAIICNALFIITQRIERSSVASGVIEDELVRLQSASLAEEDRKARHAEDAAALRALPGVRSIASTQQVPFGGSSRNTDLATSLEQRDGKLRATTYYDGGGLIGTFGLNLVAGRDFESTEYIDDNDISPAVVVITQAIADKLWPQQSGAGQSVLGRQLYIEDQPLRVIGVVERLARPSIEDRDTTFDSVILPARSKAVRGGQFVLRVDPAMRDRTLQDAAAALRRLQPNRLILQSQTFSELHADYFRQDRIMAGLLIVAVAALLVVTALGIVGLASFWVQQRRAHIGIRRALGATRTRILRYFQVENFLIVSCGIVVGMLAAYSINAWLMTHYELPRLPLIYLPLGALLMWGLGQLAVLSPALRATQVSPAQAARGA
jgi:putative ABC transport system permease protein